MSDIKLELISAKTPATITAATPNVCYGRGIGALTLKKIKLGVDANVADADAIFNLKINGVAQFSGASRPKITVGNSTGTLDVSALNITTADLAKFQIDLESVGASGIAAPVVCVIETTDDEEVLLFWDPDVAPLVPYSSQSDEFPGTTLDTSKWASYGTLTSYDVGTTIPGALTIKAPTASLAGINGVIQSSVPAGIWRFRTKARNPLVAGQGEHHAGLFVCGSSESSNHFYGFHALSMANNSYISYMNGGLGSTRANSGTNNIGIPNQPNDFCYFDVTYTTSPLKLTFSFSWDGITWHEYYSNGAPGTIARVGLLARAASGATKGQSFEWFRACDPTAPMATATGAWVKKYTSR